MLACDRAPDSRRASACPTARWICALSEATAAFQAAGRTGGALFGEWLATSLFSSAATVFAV